MKTSMMKVTLVSILLVSATALPIAATTIAVNDKASISATTAAKEKHAMFAVKGNCNECEARIEKAAKGVKGVISAKWEQKTQMLHLQYDSSQTTPEVVMKAIAKVGHDAGKFKATNAVYNALPKCCQYKR